MSAWNRLRTATLSTQQVRSVDRLAVEKYGMHSLVLMENAALGCTQWLQQHFPAGKRTLVLCGRGNNGGDGFAIARHLRILGWPCQVLGVGPAGRLSDDAQHNFRVLTAGEREEVWLTNEGRELVDVQAGDLVSNAELILDAMLGTGASGDPRAPMDDWIRLANSAAATRVAIDIPTGVDGESGRCGNPYFQAHATLTFVARKPCMSRPEARECCGEVTVLPIGIPDLLIREVLSWKV